jgi:ectoine hydroxylase-related dioxygenase (phytanoyl-CoA dioxygenase family)
MAWGGVVIVGEDLPEGDNDKILYYFCFPTMGIAIPLRKGDVILFNSKIPHALSTCVDPDYQAFCCSFYAKTMAGGGNKNLQVLTPTGEALAAQMLYTMKEIEEANKGKKDERGMEGIG